VHQSIDSEGNDQQFWFIVMKRGDSERSRVVKPFKEWWMDKAYKSEHGGDLPDDMVEETWQERIRQLQDHIFY
jgi:hypothetical protein